MALPWALDQLGSRLAFSPGSFRPAAVAPLAVLSATVATFLLAAPRSLRRLVGWPSAVRDLVGLAVALILVFWVASLAAVVAIRISQVLDLGWRSPTSADRDFSAGGRAWYLVLASFAHEHFGAPWREELLYWFLALRSLLALGLAPALVVVASAALFAVSHLPLGAASGPIALAGFFGFGAATGGLAWWTGRLAPSLAAHIGLNLLLTLGG